MYIIIVLVVLAVTCLTIDATHRHPVEAIKSIARACGLSK